MLFRSYEELLEGFAPLPEDAATAARAFQAAGQGRRAEELAREILKDDPGDAAASGILLDGAIRGRRLAEAESILRSMIERNPGSARLREKLGDVLMWAGKFAEAEAQYKAASPAPKGKTR